MKIRSLPLGTLMMTFPIDKAVCIGCGCDDFHACWDETAGQPCHWLKVDAEAGLGVCSVCTSQLPRWDTGDRELAVPVNRPPGAG